MSGNFSVVIAFVLGSVTVPAATSPTHAKLCFFFFFCFFFFAPLTYMCTCQYSYPIQHCVRVFSIYSSGEIGEASKVT